MFAGSHGLIDRNDYPYRSYDGSVPACKEDLYSKKFYLDSSSRYSAYKQVPQDWDSFLEELRKNPVAIAYAVSDEFSFYRGGIFDGPCHYQLNHAMVAVGYGQEGSKEFVIIRNSYDTTWGEQGYARVLRGPDGGTCGFYLDATVPVIA